MRLEYGSLLCEGLLLDPGILSVDNLWYRMLVTYEYHYVEKGVGAESVCTVYTDTCCLACSVQTINNVIFSIFDIKNLAMVVCWYAAHAVMYRW